MNKHPPLGPKVEFLENEDEEQKIEKEINELQKECEKLASLPNTEPNKQKITELKKRIDDLYLALRFINS